MSRSREKLEAARIELNASGREADRAFPGTGHLHYDKEGKPIGLGDWAVLHEDDDYRRVAVDYVGPYCVSTVWGGLDMGFSSFMGGPAIIFETMVFLDEIRRQQWGGATFEYMPSLDHDEDGMERYATLEEAEEGHARIVKAWERKLEEARRSEHH